MLEPTAKLAGRYRFVQSIQAGAKTVAWLAEDEQTKRRVVATAIGAARLSTLTSIVGAEHPHLATIIDVITDPDPLEIPSERGPVKAAAVAVAEYVAGTTLNDLLKRGKLSPPHAVDVILRVASAVSALHDKGGAHGAISARSIVVVPTHGRAPPVLTQLVAPTSGSYSSPQRLQGAPPSSNDDSWALHATLYAALSGAAAFSGANKQELIKSMLVPPRPLEGFGIDEPRLQLILEVGFARQPGRRPSVPELVAGLEAWSAARDKGEPLSFAEYDEDEATSLMTDSALSKLADWETTVSNSERPDEPLESGHDYAGDAARIASGAEDQPPLPSFDPGTPAEPGLDEATRRFEPVEPPKPPRPSNRPPSPPRSLVEYDRVTRESDPTLTEQLPAPLPLGTPGDWAPEFEVAPPSSIAQQGPDYAAVGARTPERRSAWVFLVPLGAALLTIAAVWGYLHYSRGTQTPRPDRSTPQPRAVPAAPTATPAADTALSPAAAKPASLAECVAAHFPPDTFRNLDSDGGDDFAFLCADDDLRSLATRLHATILEGMGPSGDASENGRRDNERTVSEGMKEWRNLGWFELPATAVVRRACCPAAVALTLPQNQGPCKQLSEVVEDVAKRPIREADAPTRAATYGEAVSCLFYYVVKRPYRYKGQTKKDQEQSFIELLHRAARAPIAALPPAAAGQSPLERLPDTGG